MPAGCASSEGGRQQVVGRLHAGAAYGANEQTLLNELKAKVNALAVAVLKTTKAP